MSSILYNINRYSKDKDKRDHNQEEIDRNRPLKERDDKTSRHEC